CQHGFGILFTF
nr:immunoglobulin light chain junction region [Macaca mulatta]